MQSSIQSFSRNSVLSQTSEWHVEVVDILVYFCVYSVHTKYLRRFWCFGVTFIVCVIWKFGYGFLEMSCAWTVDSTFPKIILLQVIFSYSIVFLSKLPLKLLTCVVTLLSFQHIFSTLDNLRSYFWTFSVYNLKKLLSFLSIDAASWHDILGKLVHRDVHIDSDPFWTWFNQISLRVVYPQRCDRKTTTFINIEIYQ